MNTNIEILHIKPEGYIENILEQHEIYKPTKHKNQTLLNEQRQFKLHIFFYLWLTVFKGATLVN